MNRRRPLPEHAVAFTVPEAAAAARIGVHALREEIRAGRLRTKMAGRLRLVPRSELEKLVEALPDG